MNVDRIDAIPEHDPVLVTDDDLDDLSSFTGMSRSACLDRLRGYCAGELAEAWRRAHPVTSEAILAFYQSTDLYIWALMQWHAGTARRAYREALEYVVEHYPAHAGWRLVYDFGSGVGTDALFLSSHGYDVTLVDVDSPAFRFARHRFKRRGQTARFVESISTLPKPDGFYDVIVCFDVFEHLLDPLGAAKQLIAALRGGGLIVQQGSFVDEGHHPCHLARGVQRFGGLKWHIHLAGLGLRHLTGMVYCKGSPVQRFIQVGRYWLWRMTGFWLLRVSG